MIQLLCEAHIRRWTRLTLWATAHDMCTRRSTANTSRLRSHQSPKSHSGHRCGVTLRTCLIALALPAKVGSEHARPCSTAVVYSPAPTSLTSLRRNCSALSTLCIIRRLGHARRGHRSVVAARHCEGRPSGDTAAASPKLPPPLLSSQLAKSRTILWAGAL